MHCNHYILITTYNMHCNNYILCILVLLNAFFHVHAERFKIENFDIFNLIDACEAPSFIQY